VVKTILYKRTIALGTSIDFRKDLRRSEPRGDSGGSGWRKEAGGRIHNIKEKTPREIFSTFRDHEGDERYFCPYLAIKKEK